MKKNTFFYLLILVLIVSNIKAQISSTSFPNYTNLPTGSLGNIHTACGDIDGDGKNDVVVANEANGKLSIFRNTSSSGIVSFASSIDYTPASNLGFLHLADLDSDGKPDIIVSTSSSVSVVVYRNLSTSGNILLGSKQTFTVGGTNAWGMAVGDLDGDGKPDVVASNNGGGSYSILRNTSTNGTISLAMASVISASALVNPMQVSMADLDTDGKNDLVFCNNSGNNLVIYQNLSFTPGIITMSSVAQTLTANSGPHRGDVADVDGDGKPDIVCSNYFSGNSSIFKNTSTPGTISFLAKADFTGSSNVHSSLLKDLDSDGKPELIQSCGAGASSRVSIFRNFCYSGTVTNAFFSNRVDFIADNEPRGIAVGDLDGDGKLDIMSANYSSTSISVFKNQSTPSNGLVAYYPFTGNAGDSSGFGNHGTVPAGGPVLTTDRFGSPNKAYYFDGGTDVITVPAHISLRPYNTLTLAAWIKSEPKTGGAWNFILSYRHSLSSAPFDSYKIATIPTSPYSNKWSFGIAGAVSAQTELLSTKVKQDYIWQHLAVTYDGADMKIYINGVLDTSMATSFTNIIYGTLGLYIGNSRASSSIDAFLGALDDIRIYNRALSLAEIKQLAGIEGKTYYSKTLGPLNQPSTWGENTDGTGSSPLNFDSANVTYHVVNNTSPSLGGTFKINGVNSRLIIGDGVNAFNLSVAANDTLSCDSVYLNNNITITAMGSFITTKLNSSGSSTVQYLSSTSQQLAAGIYNNLIVSGSTKTLTGNTTVKATLGMLNSINTATYNLTLGTSTASTGTLNRTQGTIIGKFTRWFASTTNTGATGSFPVGIASRYAPFQLEFTTAPASGGTVSAEFIPVAPGNNGLPVYDFSNGFIFLDKAAIDGYWRLTSTISSGNFTASATANNFTGVNAFADLRMVKRALNGNWNISGTALTTTGSNASAVIGRSGLNGVEAEYGVAGDESNNPLPVKLVNFSGTKINNGLSLVSWQTAYETNAAKFVLQRFNGKTWEHRAVIAAKGQSNILNNYSVYDDIKFLEGDIFYRLLQTDIDGDNHISQVIVINSSDIESVNIIVYPNPAKENITVTNLNEEAAIYNINGQFVKTIPANGTLSVSELNAGLYFIKASGRVIKFVKE